MRDVLNCALVVLVLGFAQGCGPSDGRGPKPQSTPAVEAAKAEQPKSIEVIPEPPASEPSPDAAQPAQAIRTQEALEAALKTKNPGLKGEVVAQSDGRNLVAVKVNDPGLTEIGPLAGLPLQMLDLSQCRVEDIKPLRGMPLRELYLEGTQVRDLGPLAGMPLVKLYLSKTPVEDLKPLAGRPLEELNLLGTRVTDLSPLRGSRIRMLWLNDTPVSDISPLADVPLVSLTLAGTKVSDLSPLKNHPLERLHIANTEVTDLSPLASMRLVRLIFTPGRIKTGLDVARKMPTLAEIGTAFGEGPDTRMAPADFWRRFDAGEIK